MALLGCFATCSLWAREVTPEEAMLAATRWAEQNPDFIQVCGEVCSPERVCDDDGNILYYKVAFEEKGMVILSGDTEIAPILAAVPDAVGSNIPEGHPLAALLLKDAAARRQYFLSDTGSALKMLSTATSALDEERQKAETRWGELLSIPRLKAASSGGTTVSKIYAYPERWANNQLTHWNQTSRNNYNTWTTHTVYDRYTPNNYLVGCVAVSGAAVLEHFQVPQGPTAGVVKTVGIGSDLNNITETSEYTTKGGAYDWSSLGEWTKGKTLDEEQKDLLGRVACDIGLCTGMAYTPSASGTMAGALAPAFVNDYGFAHAEYWYTVANYPNYNKKIEEYDGSSRKLTGNFYEPYIYTQLRCGIPVPLGILTSSGGGHAVLAVGYGEESDTSYTRIFMGWGGAGDAWYALPNIENYTAIDEVITLMAYEGDEVVALTGEVCDASGISVKDYPVTINGATGTVRHLLTGDLGEYATRMSKQDAPYTITVGAETQEITTHTPGFIDFTLPATDFDVSIEGLASATQHWLEDAALKQGIASGVFITNATAESLERARLLGVTPTFTETLAHTTTPTYTVAADAVIAVTALSVDDEQITFGITVSTTTGILPQAYAPMGTPHLLAYTSLSDTTPTSTPVSSTWQTDTTCKTATATFTTSRDTASFFKLSVK